MSRNVRLDYESPGKHRPSSWPMACLVLAALPHAAFAVLAFLEIIDFWGPGIPFFDPIPLAAFTAGAALVEGTAFVASLVVRRRLRTAAFAGGQRLVSFASYLSGYTLLGIVALAIVFASLNGAL